MTAHQVVLVPGDGIGPEVTSAARTVLDATGVRIDWIEAPAGEQVYAATGQTLPGRTAELVRDVGVTLKGPMANPVGHGYRSPNIALRQAAGVYVNVRSAYAHDGVPTRCPGTDLVVIREVTEDVFTGAAQYVGPDAAVAIKYVTRAATHRVTRFAFDYARRHGRRRITVAHKAATLKETDGLFLAAARQIAAAERGPVALDDCLVDALAMRLVRDPRGHDVLLAPFQYGDILADLCAGLAGGLGMAPGASFGDRTAIFEAAHGSAPKYAGRDVANPCAVILSGALLLDHVVADGRVTTRDLGGDAGTAAMTDAIAAAVLASAGRRSA